MTFEQGGIFIVPRYPCCDTGPRCLRSHQKDRPSIIASHGEKRGTEVIFHNRLYVLNLRAVLFRDMTYM